jgi:FAD binding domain
MEASTLHGGTIRLERSRLDQLQARLRGTLLLREDDRYDAARRVWNAMVDKHPAMIAGCADVDDVAQCVRFAREYELLVSIRGGGHNVAGNAACDGGMVIDLSPMKRLRVDPVARTARAEPGVVWGEFDRETQARSRHDRRAGLDDGHRRDGLIDLRVQERVGTVVGVPAAVPLPCVDDDEDPQVDLRESEALGRVGLTNSISLRRRSGQPPLTSSKPSSFMLTIASNRFTWIAVESSGWPPGTTRMSMSPVSALRKLRRSICSKTRAPSVNMPLMFNSVSRYRTSFRT